MLGCMESEIQKQLMEMQAYTMIGHLKEMFQEKANIWKVQYHQGTALLQADC